MSSPVLDLDLLYETIEDGKVKNLKGRDGKIPVGPDGRPIIADPRSKTTSALLVIHLLFINVHNHIVDELQRECRGLTSDELWERAKQINIALYQQMTYNEILSAMIGDNNARNASLGTQDPMEDGLVPVVISEYANAAGRQCHEFITGK